MAGRRAKKNKGPPSQSEAVPILRHMKSSLPLWPLISFFFFWRCEFNPEYVERRNSSANSIHRKCLGSRGIAVHMKGSGEHSHCRLLFGGEGVFLHQWRMWTGHHWFMFHFYPLLPTHVAPPKHKARWIIYNAFMRKNTKPELKVSVAVLLTSEWIIQQNLRIQVGSKCSRSGVLVAMETFSAHASHSVAYQKLRLDWFLSVLTSSCPGGIKKKKATSKSIQLFERNLTFFRCCFFLMWCECKFIFWVVLSGEKVAGFSSQEE